MVTNLPDAKFGLNTTATQQYQTLLRENPDVEPDFRQQYMKDLRSLLYQFTDENIILTGNFNLPPHQKFLNSVKIENGLADAITESAKRKYVNIPIFRYGKERVDHVFVSWSLLPHISYVRI